MRYSSGLTELEDIKKRFYITEYQIASYGNDYDETDYEVNVPDNIRKYVYGKNETYPNWFYNPEFYKFIKVNDFFEMNEKYTVDWSYNSYYISVYEDENYINKKPSFRFPSSKLIWKKLHTKYLLVKEISYEGKITNPEYLVTSFFDFKDPNWVWEQKKVGDYIQFVDTSRMMEFKQKFIDQFDEGKTFFIIC